MKIIFAGTPEFAKIALVHLIASKYNVIAVYTQPDRPAGRGRQLQASPVKTFAQEHHIPVHQPITLRDSNAQKTFAELKPDLMVVAAYGLLLPKDILNIPTFGCINIHASLLPRWRGAAPIQHAIMAGDVRTGITIMQMDEGLDTGDSLLQMPCEIHAKETSATLLARLSEIGSEAVIQVIEDIKTNRLQPVKQDANLATYAVKINKSEALINWELSAAQLDRNIRAFNPWPIAHSHLESELVRIWQATPLTQPTTALPGTIVETTLDAVYVATGSGLLAVEKVQFAGGKLLDIKDVLHAKADKFKVGKRFE